jgi:hypothetical protein
MKSIVIDSADKSGLTSDTRGLTSDTSQTDLICGLAGRRHEKSRPEGRLRWFQGKAGGVNQH